MVAACGHKTEIGTIPTNGVIIELGSSTIEARQVQDCASVSDALKKEHTLQGHVWSEELSYCFRRLEAQLHERLEGYSTSGRLAD